MPTLAPLLRRLLLAAPMLACSPAGASAPPPAADAPAAVVPASPQPSATRAAPTTVILVRHGEKATDDPKDPSLSPAGEARARALAAMLAGAGVTHCFASEFRRTQATLRPLAAAIGLEISVVPAADPQALVAALRQLPPGSVAAVAGHSNTVPALVTALGGSVRGTVDSPAGPALPDDAYDRMFVVHVPAAKDEPSTTLELRYAGGVP
jgi:phosphohistidine phosphatase SixA